MLLFTYSLSPVDIVDCHNNNPQSLLARGLPIGQMIPSLTSLRSEKGNPQQDSGWRNVRLQCQSISRTKPVFNEPFVCIPQVAIRDTRKERESFAASKQKDLLSVELSVATSVANGQRPLWRSRCNAPTSANITKESAQK